MVVDTEVILYVIGINGVFRRSHSMKRCSWKHEDVSIFSDKSFQITLFVSIKVSVVKVECFDNHVFILFRVAIMSRRT